MADREKSLKDRLREDEEEDPVEARKIAGREMLRRQQEAAERQTKKLEEEKLADKVKVADAFGLSPEEKDTYLNRELGKDSLKERVSQSPAAETKPYTVPAEPLVLAPKDSTATPTMDDTADTNEAEVAGYGKEVKAALGKVNSLLNQANQMKPHDRAFFEKQVEKAQTIFKEAEGKLEQRELAEKMAHALTQLGAGMHGLKTGTDMSGLKFDKTDWTKKLELQLGKFRDALDAARDEDRMARAENDSRRSSLVQQASVASGVAGTLAAADSRQAAAQAAADAKKEREGLKSEKAQRDAYIKRKGEWDKFQASLKNAKNLDPDITVSQLRSRAIALGGNASEIDSLIKKAKGWGGMDEADTKDAAALINDYVATLPEPTFSASPAAGEIERLDKNTGKVAVFDAETKKFKRWK